jgi:tyrosyl-tRNA synthetase
MTLYEDLKWRGLIKDISSPELEEKLNKGGMTFYIGTDPTADSMHIGHFSSFLIAARLKKFGHNPLLLIGGATGMIGDPKPTNERPMITKEEAKHNADCLAKQAHDIFGFEIVNNLDWSQNINFIDFLRDYGKYFNINYMLDKDIIRRRLDEGITYTEFSYMIMQSLDYEYLYTHRNCTLQVAGQDQWGNITAGIDLIRKKDNAEVYGFTMPLVLDKNGKKFGKTEGNALWLDKNKTSSYELYQYLVNADDEMVIDYLKKLTFLTKEEIENIAKIHQAAPEKRYAQKKLAEEIITFLHGKSEYEKAVKISECLFTEKINTLSANDILENLKDVPSFSVEKGTILIDMLVNNKICSSRREAREFLSSGAISINNEKISDENTIINEKFAIDSKIIVLRKGKKNYFLGQLV